LGVAGFGGAGLATVTAAIFLTTLTGIRSKCGGDFDSGRNVSSQTTIPASRAYGLDRFASGSIHLGCQLRAARSVF
jgi:hypothetical protein